MNRLPLPSPPRCLRWGTRLCPRLAAIGVCLWLIASSALPASAQVRTKAPDRGVYRPPQLVRPAADSRRLGTKPTGGANRSRTEAESGDGLVEVVVEPRLREFPNTEAASGDAGSAARLVRPTIGLRQVAHEEEAVLDEVPSPSPRQSLSESVIPTVDATGPLAEMVPISGRACGQCDACDGLGCDELACDSLVCSPGRRRGVPWGNASISLRPEKWFGSLELLLMFRSGDRLPPLVTTGPVDDADTAGEIGQSGTRVLFGDDTFLKDMTAGGRFMVGTWLDSRQCRSLTIRGWFAGEESVGFHTDQNATPVIARPFLNVTNGQTPAQDTQLVAFPDRSTGFIDVRADSNVYGADVAVRQYWHGGYGATVDLLYGYQYMRLDERLGIQNTSISLDDDFAPIGSTLSIADAFEAENEFHGGQLGIASRYREGCWSFDGLIKVGFGQLRRQATRRGRTVTSIDGATATSAEGLLVQNTNRGTFTDHTFGWVPELDLSLGWHRFPRFDVTVGYHLIVMTDALQPGGTIDSDLAVNLSDPLTGDPRPEALVRYDTFYIQGIHFGLQYRY